VSETQAHISRKIVDSDPDTRVGRGEAGRVGDRSKDETAVADGLVAEQADHGDDDHGPDQPGGDCHPHVRVARDPAGAILQQAAVSQLREPRFELGAVPVDPVVPAALEPVAAGDGRR
jgi:hypothetical protein